MRPKKIPRSQREEYKRLTREEELAAWQAGDYDALVNSVWPFVLKTARSVAPENSYLYDELLSEAGLAISHALKGFDPSQSRFISYSCRFLYSKMQKAAERFSRINSAGMTGAVEDGIAAPAEEDRIETEETYHVLAGRLGKVCSDLEIETMMRWAAGEQLTGIAKTRGVSRQAVQSALVRGLSRAQRALPSLAEDRANPH